MSAQRKGRAMGTGMDLAEAAGTPDFYAVGRLRARVAELEVEVNLLHRQRHAAQEDAANARLLAEVRQLSQGEIDRLRAELAALRGQVGGVVPELTGEDARALINEAGRRLCGDQSEASDLDIKLVKELWVKFASRLPSSRVAGEGE